MTLRFSLTVLAAALLLPGCVSSGKYKALLKANEDLESQIASLTKSARGLESDLGAAQKSNSELSSAKSGLEQEKGALQKEKSELEQVKASLEARTGELEAAKAQLSARTAELEQQKGALEAEKAALLKANQEKEAQYQGLVGDLKKEVADGQLKITQYKDRLTVDVADRILFDSGRADLKKDGKAVLKKVGEALAQNNVGKVIRVSGHTDNVPLSSGAAYPSNWELSAARATMVVRFLQEQAKLDPKALVAEGRGEYAPVAPNDTPENKQKNRRIEISLVDPALYSSEPAKP
jgi:chemotaxis protein MotB